MVHHPQDPPPHQGRTSQEEHLHLVGWLLLLVSAFATLVVVAFHFLFSPTMEVGQFPAALIWCLLPMILGMAVIAQTLPRH